ncbi:MAG TPA: homoaconitase [Actinobacteria bacterium]|nr:2,3-dimethylmalate dehydratase large subunit [bacterium BMS3Bbin01]HDH25355.1 homoaconitase [Actinomycetota bacterium]
MTRPQTVVEAITQTHLAGTVKSGSVQAGDFVTIRPDHVLTHDNTAPVLKKFQTMGATRVSDPKQPVFALDHDIQNTSEANLAKYRKIEEFARSQGVDFYAAGEGIGHQIMVEQGYVTPGSFVVASDSHANIYGALGAIGTPVVRTDAAAIWATREFWWQVPRTVRVELIGELPSGAAGKDVILILCGLYSHGEVLNAAVEFTGPGVKSLTMEARLTISNMTTEWGALVGWFPVDRITLDYLAWRRGAIGPRGRRRLGDIRDTVVGYASADPDARYAANIVFDLGEVIPHVNGPDTVQATRSLMTIQEQAVSIDKAYLVSCVNSRFEDLAAAARELVGRHVADGVELYFAAASREVQERAEAAGHWQTILDAGGRPLPPGCGPCIGLGTGLLAAGEVGISATNRNFKGRMGSRDAQCYLASPQVVAASAVAGHICGPGDWPDHVLQPSIDVADRSVPDVAKSVTIKEGFPARLEGRIVLLTQDNINTDGIYGKDYTYRDDMTPEAMARVVMENYDPEFASMIRPGDILIGGHNFGTGSSREQAATALQAAGIAMVIASSYSQTYLRNAFNNGFVCVECPELVAYLREMFATAIDRGARSIFSDDTLSVDFTTGKVSVENRVFRFPVLGEVPQSLVAAGGLENAVRRRLS